MCIQREAFGAHGDLLWRFFAAHVEHRRTARDRRERLQQQRRFTDARVATNQHDTAIDQPAAENAIKFADAGGAARHIFSANFR